jgi:uncharacterized membrane protein YoaK (UPF0700 family)
MSPEQLKIITDRRHYFNWFALAFLAGSVNVGGYLACQRFVTHVTGFATLFGADVSALRWADGLSMLSVPLFFVGGAMLSGWLIERRMNLGLKPRYATALSVVVFCLYFSAMGGHWGWFGPFGNALVVKQDYLLLALLCTASGIQNAVVTSVSGSVIRTTHLTGITTDLGTGLVRVMFPAPGEGKQLKERKLNRLRLGSILSFILGSGVGAFVYRNNGYLGFLLPAGIATYMLAAAKIFWKADTFNVH